MTRELDKYYFIIKQLYLSVTLNGYYFDILLRLKLPRKR